MRQTVARRRRIDDDEGFSLVEVIVAMVIAVSSLLGLLTASLYSVRATLTARQNLQAANYLNQTVENARSLDYAAVTMVSTDVPGSDSLIGTSGGNYYFRPSTQQACTPVAGDTTCEKLDVQTVGSISQHVQSLSTSNGTYTVKRYVSIPSTADVSSGTASERRLTVIVSWSTYGRTHSRVLSTVITNTRRGLPLPRYTLAANGPAGTAQAKNPGNTVDIGLAITNLGARDSYTMTANAAGSPWTGSWIFYKDTDGDGVHDTDGTEPALTGGVTDLLDPGSAAPFYVIAENTLNSTTTGTFTVTFSATSVANPTYAAKTLTDTVTVTAGAVSNPTPTPTATVSPAPASNCNPGSNTSVAGTAINASTGASVPNGSGTLTNLYFSNAGTNDSTTQATNTMSSSTSILQSSLCNYATDQQTNQAGRLLAQNTSSNATWKSAIWTYTPAAKTTYAGTAALVLGVQCPSGTPTISYTVTQGAVSLGTGSIVLDSSCNAGAFKRVESTFTVSSSSPNDKNTVTVTLTSANAPVRIAMGATTYESRLTMGLK